MSTQTFPLSGPINLLARLGTGSLSVQLEDNRTEAEVTLVARKKDSDILERMTVEMSGPTLSIIAPRQGGVLDMFASFARSPRDAVDVTVLIPSGTALKIGTFSASVTVRGRSGGADVSTGSATVELDEVDGDLRLRFGSGSGRVGRVAGSAVVRCGAGNAQFGEVVGDLSCGSGSGELDVACARGAVRSRTGSGTARFAAVYGDVDVASGSGELSIGLPAGIAARLDVTTGSGRVESDLPIHDVPQRQSGSITVRARTGSGNIRVFRAA
jgi:hypothetical protein